MAVGVEEGEGDGTGGGESVRDGVGLGEGDLVGDTEGTTVGEEFMGNSVRSSLIEIGLAIQNIELALPSPVHIILPPDM
jgi:hypothetical protein